MEKIEIEVDESTAKAYNRFSDETKSKFNESVAITLKKVINDANAEHHKRFLNELSDEAEKNDMTGCVLDVSI